LCSGTINGVPVSFTPWTVSGFAPPSNTGIIFELPLYDPRTGYEHVPGLFEIYIGYRGAGGADSQLLNILSNHKDLLTTVDVLLESNIAKSVKATDLIKVNEFLVREGTINRKRLSIGIKDIYTSQNTYEKQGVYVSPYYVNDVGLYTFSLKVKETIPAYRDTDPYSTVRYFAEFNSLGWEPISPISRNQEYDLSGNIIPKMLVFDKTVGASSVNVKYLGYSVSVTSFRIKIVLDISAVKGMIIPPEVNDYRCVIFDKTQLMEI
jgi:hypothetical protein